MLHLWMALCAVKPAADGLKASRSQEENNAITVAHTGASGEIKCLLLVRRREMRDKHGNLPIMEAGWRRLMKCTRRTHEDGDGAEQRCFLLFSASFRDRGTIFSHSEVSSKFNTTSEINLRVGRQNNNNNKSIWRFFNFSPGVFLSTLTRNDTEIVYLI